MAAHSYLAHQRASEPAAEEHSLHNCLSSWHKCRVGWKVGNFPDWVNFKQNRFVFSLWRCISGGFIHPSSAAGYGTITVPCKLLPSHSAGGIHPWWEKCPAQSHILPRAIASCAYKVNKHQRRWQEEVKTLKRRKVFTKKPKPVWTKQGPSTCHVLPCNRKPK